MIRHPASWPRRPRGRCPCRCAVIAVLLALPSFPLLAQQPFQPAVLPWRTGPLDWSGPTRPSGYLGVIGRSAVAFGREDALKAAGGMRIAVRHGRGWRLERAPVVPSRGDRSRQLKVLDARIEGDGLLVAAGGLAGGRYQVCVIAPSATWVDTLVIGSAGGDVRDGYVRVNRRLRR